MDDSARITVEPAFFLASTSAGTLGRGMEIRMPSSSTKTEMRFINSRLTTFFLKRTRITAPGGRSFEACRSTRFSSGSLAFTQRRLAVTPPMRSISTDPLRSGIASALLASSSLVAVTVKSSVLARPSKITRSTRPGLAIAGSTIPAIRMSTVGMVARCFIVSDFALNSEQSKN